MAVAEIQRGNIEAYRQRSVANRILPWRREPAPAELHASGNETTLYEKGKGNTTRKVVGETMVWGGGIFGVYNLLTLDLPGALGGAVVHVAGRWVRPKEGQ